MLRENIGPSHHRGMELATFHEGHPANALRQQLRVKHTPRKRPVQHPQINTRQISP